MSCERPDGDVFERMVWKPFMLRCWDHGPGLDGRQESAPPAWFRVCTECGHVYRTEGELVSEENAARHRASAALGFDWADVASAVEVGGCPLCAQAWQP